MQPGIIRLSGLFFLLIGSALVLSSFGRVDNAEKDFSPEQPCEWVFKISDKSLALFQDKLLDLAFETASSIPMNPHIKDRSRAQETVVLACLHLDCPKRALRYMDQIVDWRRGSCYADLAFYFARRDCIDDARRCIQIASQISESAEDWRRDRIRVKIAQTYVWLGQNQQVDEFEAGVVDSELGKVARVKAMRSDADAFHEQMQVLETRMESGNFDIMNNTLQAYTELFHRFYSDVQKRSLVEEKIKTAWNGMPISTRIERLTDLAEFALEHSDSDKALALVNDAQSLIDGRQWPLEHFIPMMGKLAALRFRTGDRQKARSEADAARVLFHAQKDTIVNIWKAGTLRPLAQAYQTMEDPDAALSLYKQALAAGIENPNSRPRAEDLTATCLSMALYAVEPDDDLWGQAHRIYQGLDHPW
ncbi:MAG: tetratricopeptide repeat protein [Candidatus Omnitrophota bacterium]|nr:MAG: tetratricopeptide repeat protein [Candidatus Omnitrophota bacterium]